MAVFGRKSLARKRRFRQKPCSVENSILLLRAPPPLGTLAAERSGGSHVPATHSPDASGQDLHLLRARRDRSLTQRPRSPTDHLLPWPPRLSPAAGLAAYRRAPPRPRL